MVAVYTEKNTFIASTKRFVNIASANQSCSSVYFKSYNNTISYHNKYICCRNKVKLSPQQFWLL